MISVNTDKCIKLAEHYGFWQQLEKLAEECRELYWAIDTLLGVPKDREKLEAMTEELADVMIVCEQMKSLMGDSLQAWLDFKVARQLLRLQTGKPKLGALHQSPPREPTPHPETRVQAEARRIADIALAIAGRDSDAFPAEQRDAAVSSLCKAVDDLQNAMLEDEEAQHG